MMVEELKELIIFSCQREKERMKKKLGRFNFRIDANTIYVADL